MKHPVDYWFKEEESNYWHYSLETKWQWTLST